MHFVSFSSIFLFWTFINNVLSKFWLFFCLLRHSTIFFSLFNNSQTISWFYRRYCCCCQNNEIDKTDSNRQKNNQEQHYCSPLINQINKHRKSVARKSFAERKMLEEICSEGGKEVKHKKLKIHVV